MTKTQRDLVVIGASAGGIAALQKLVRALPPDFPAAILLVVHMSPHSPGLLPEIVNGFGPLPASNARHGEPIENGHIYVAPPDRHLLAGVNRTLQIGHGPKENRFRPAVDPLFRSAALNYGAQTIGIVLSGGLDDGTAGLCTIKQAGGLAIVQDPAEAQSPSMPRNALNHVAIDHCLSADGIGAMLPQLVREAPAGDICALSDETRMEVTLAADERNQADIQKLGEPSSYTCPSCHGSLFRAYNATPVRFRCHTGHAFTALTLESELQDKMENAAWNAVRTFQEQAMLFGEMATRPGISNQEASNYSLRAELALKRAQLLRESIALEPESEQTAGRKANS
jgi:two-component system, chemotaxis family, protein-glutamate methylesterase/glutaminase